MDSLLRPAIFPLKGDLTDLRYPMLVTVLSYILLVYMGISVGRARKRFGVKIPKITGPPEFERTFRAHQNQIEQISTFYVLLWSFSLLVSPTLGAVIGLVWTVLRYLYFCRYRDTGKNIGQFTVPAYMCLNSYVLGLLLKAVSTFF